MCKRCDERIAKLMGEIQTLAGGELPEGHEIPESADTPEKQEQFRLELIIARAAVILARHLDVPPSFACGMIAGKLMEAEAASALQDIAIEQMIRDTAHLN
jgi:hypothetical protein